MLGFFSIKIYQSILDRLKNLIVEEVIFISDSKWSLENMNLSFEVISLEMRSFTSHL